MRRGSYRDRGARLAGKTRRVAAAVPWVQDLVGLHPAGQHTVSELEQLSSVTRSTVYRAVGRAAATSMPLQWQNHPKSGPFGGHALNKSSA